mmetsp:Transcript_76680/g.135422  ORF Transcript_76680/g.135422 Transcript_76680/m.135422 type:complete len:661 (-) Transcript_76680:710-2692(-)
MSEPIKHECGIAMLRLRKDLSFYAEKYGTPFYGLLKTFLLMEKQHNRGQEGAGIAALQLDMDPGYPYIHRKREFGTNAMRDVFKGVDESRNKVKSEILENAKTNTKELKEACGYAAELYMGHLRYGTSGPNSHEACHPFHRASNWKTRNLVVAGNFNLTNNQELLQELINHGQHPVELQDTVLLMERIAYHLDQENAMLHSKHSKIPKEEQDRLSLVESRRRSTNPLQHTNIDIAERIANELDIESIMKQASHDWDGGYVFGVLFGHGDACILRDPQGIRPAWYYVDDEVIVVASERPPIQTAFDLPSSKVKEIPPGHALILKRDGSVSEPILINEPKESAACSFERIYFARPTDEDIYKERRALGKYLCPAVLASVDLKHTVFSFIPNSSEICFLGLIEALQSHLKEKMKEEILQLGNDITPGKLDEILSLSVRTHKVAVKDQKLRTFIAQDKGRDDLVSHSYDITYGTIVENVDTLVAVEDSIVRGTTLKKSILRMLGRLHPKAIIVVSSSPHIRYPDCYGIDMAKMGDFIAFRAAIELLKDNGQEHVIEEVYEVCKEDPESANHVKRIYEPFTDEQISKKIGEMLKPDDMKCPVTVIYQKVEDVYRACPQNPGVWYFTGDYPTKGGAKVCNKSYVMWYEKSDGRAYDFPNITRRSSL